MALFTAEDYEALPPGLYAGELRDIEPRESANGEYRRWGWEIMEGPYAGRMVYAIPPRTLDLRPRHAFGSRTSWAAS